MIQIIYKFSNFFTLVICTLLLQTTRVSAEAGPISLSDAVSIALEKNSNVLRFMSIVQESQYSLALAKSNFYPRISANVGVAKRKDRYISGSDIAPAYREADGAVSFVQPLFDQTVTGGVSVANEELAIKEIGVQNIKRNTKADVVNAYFDLLVKKSKLETLLDAQKTLISLLASGRSGGFQIRTRLTTITSQITKAESEVSLSAAELSLLLGMDHPEQIQIAGQLNKVDMEKVYSINELLATDLNPELQRANLEESVLEKRRKLEIYGYRPRLELIGSYYQIFDSNIQLEDDKAWSIGIQLTIPLFSGGASIHGSNIYGAQIEQRRQFNRGVNARIELNRFRAENSISTAKNVLASSKKAHRLALDNLKESRAANSEIANAMSSYIESKNAMDQAIVALVSAEVDFALANNLPMDKLIEYLN